MTIMATHFALVLGAWRLRVRIDLDEPRGEAGDAGTAADDRMQPDAGAQHRTRPTVASGPPWN
jgi:hypothetical protein